MRLKMEEINFDERGLVPAVVQDAKTGEVLTLAYMNAESLRRTLEEGETWFWSRSRSELWHKGKTSGNTQRVVDVRLDCDADALVVLVEPNGPACHTGARSCFPQEFEGAHRAGGEAGGKIEREAGDFAVVLERLYQVVESRRREMPEGSYTTYLFEQGLDKILKKVGEESAETIIAAKNGDAEALAAELSDLVYHLIVLMVERGLALGDVSVELARRAGKRSR
ncbi:MAG: bifunctional phosphoribosyl-AMP cyclohydrolase/phosphoribosyl-ATP diphosphatase HisIE [Acidobacteria bacterium]|nr:bifunctional phosphoribosyl-AMP cyclohydrolase/phosphoribosyl-ATP diphosphatase HisIE [Acidobacteriota bacterium]